MLAYSLQLSCLRGCGDEASSALGASLSAVTVVEF